MNADDIRHRFAELRAKGMRHKAVSYTHLTLPTKA